MLVWSNLIADAGGRSTRKASEPRILESLRAEGEAKVDLEFLALYEHYARLRNFAGAWDSTKPAKPETSQAAIAALRRRLDERLGGLPLVGDKPAPGSDKEAVQWGSVQRQKLLLEISLTGFADLSEGLPVLAEWLYRQGGTTLRYDFRSFGSESRNAPAGTDQEDNK